MLLRNLRSGLEFHAARNCFYNYFGEAIETYCKESKQLRSLLDGALALLVHRFDELISFPCRAADGGPEGARADCSRLLARCTGHRTRACPRSET